MERKTIRTRKGGRHEIPAPEKGRKGKVNQEQQENGDAESSQA